MSDHEITTAPGEPKRNLGFYCVRPLEACESGDSLQAVRFASKGGI